MARKKIYDIRPPKKKSVFSVARSKSLLPKKALSIKLPEIIRKQLSGGRKDIKSSLLCPRNVLIISIGALFGLFVLLSFSAKADVKVFPTENVIELEQKINAKAGILGMDLEQGVIRAKLLSKEKQLTETFPATGVSQTATYARGKIEVVNDYHLQQVLISVPGRRTRFLSADGKLFYLQETVTIPAGQRVEVDVVAAEAGPDYNIGPTTFSIPGLLGSPRYTSVYAESKSEMAGGSRGETAQITEKDLKNAEEQLQNSAKEALKQELQQMAGDSFIVPDKGFELTILETSSSSSVGENVNDFQFTLKVRGDGLAYSKEDLNSLAKNRVEQSIGQGQALKKGTLGLETVVGWLDLEKETMELGVKISAGILKEINQTELTKALLGKSIRETKSYFSSCPDIEKAEIKIYPFWIKKIPDNFNRVHIEIAGNSLTD